MQYRSVTKNKTEEEMVRVNNNPQMWHVQNVLHYLHAIVEKSNIDAQLIAFRDNADIAEVCTRFCCLIWSVSGRSLKCLVALDCVQRAICVSRCGQPSLRNVGHSATTPRLLTRRLDPIAPPISFQAAGEFGKHPLYQMLGYFSLISLCRLHCLLGDYYQALKVLDNIDLNKKVGIHFFFLLASLLPSFLPSFLPSSFYPFSFPFPFLLGDREPHTHK